MLLGPPGQADQKYKVKFTYNGFFEPQTPRKQSMIHNLRHTTITEQRTVFCATMSVAPSLLRCENSGRRRLL